MGKTAIVLGATGLTGSHVLNILLNDQRYEKVKLFTRNPVERKHPKIEEHVVDLFHFESFKNDFIANEVYCCIGTTKSKTPDKGLYKKIDYGIPVDAAKYSKVNGIKTYLVISAISAKVDSSISYVKFKGEMERDVAAQQIENTYFFKPSLIAGNRDENRSGENIGKVLLGFLNPLMIGNLKKYRSVSPEIIARAMVRTANSGYYTSHIDTAEIKEIASS